MNAPRCSVCSSPIVSGGRKTGDRPLCPAHYFRERRGSARALDPTLGQAKKVPVAERLRLLTAALSAVKRDLRKSNRKLGWVDDRMSPLSSSTIARIEEALAAVGESR